MKRGWGVSIVGGVGAALVIGLAKGGDDIVRWLDDFGRAGGGVGTHGDDFGRGAGGVGRGADGGGEVVIDAAKEGVKTMNELRNGTDYEKVVWRVACDSMKAFIADTDTYKDYKADINARLAYQDPNLPQLAGPAVSRAAHALTLAEAHGGLLHYQVRYCGI